MCSPTSPAEFNNPSEWTIAKHLAALAFSDSGLLTICPKSWETLRCSAAFFVDALIGEPDAAYELSESRVSMQWLESSSRFEICELRIPLLIGLFQPDKSFVRFAQRSI